MLRMGAEFTRIGGNVLGATEAQKLLTCWKVIAYVWMDVEEPHSSG